MVPAPTSFLPRDAGEDEGGGKRLVRQRTDQPQIVWLKRFERILPPPGLLAQGHVGLTAKSVMKQIAQVLLFDRDRKLLIYLRDDKPNIPFPNHWDFFGGHVEEGETPEQALMREVKEELGFDLLNWEFVRRYECAEGDAYPNIKYVYRANIDKQPAELVLAEGQRLTSIAMEERFDFRFANILGRILEDFIESGLWPKPVDNSSTKILAK
jgi:8-oxo-dGTP diphosphatase